MAALGMNRGGIWIPCDGQHGATVGSSTGKSFSMNKPKKHEDSYQDLLPVLAHFLKRLCLKSLLPNHKNVGCHERQRKIKEPCEVKGNLQRHDN